MVNKWDTGVAGFDEQKVKIASCCVEEESLDNQKVERKREKE